jgi:hypothetical protein
MKRNEPPPRPAVADRPTNRVRKAYRKPTLKRLGVLKSVAGSDLKWAPRY